jgi:MutS2 family protein
MTNKHFRALELEKVLAMLSAETSSREAEQMALEVEPCFQKEEVDTLLAETDSAFVLMAKFGAPSFYGLKNVTNALRRAQAGGGLNMRELLDVAETLRAIRALKQWREKSAGMKTALDRHFFMLAPNKSIEEKIFSAIKSEEEMMDDASPTLNTIRRKIRNASSGIRDKLDKLIHSQTHQKHLQDAIVTMRSGRYVVPVKAEHRGEVAGLIHDSSASGATVFIEPMAVVEANNEIRILKAQEIEEISRILLELSGEVGGFADEIVEGFQFATQIDLIFAKAHLAYKMKATLPLINMQGKIKIERGRHPLIDPKKVVPIDINLGYSFDSLIITGPNTGGKTVALKTLGLLTLMAMCGLMIPAGEESEIAIFNHILADIGDEQSIEQSLSTFSAHMTNIIGILKEADNSSLVLMDELGAGTDPVEGAALAMSIIEELRAKKVHLACTTHYAELKEYALQTEGTENACCEFDVETLRPTYRLLIGVPGKSNAFAISQKLGISEKVVDRARNFVSVKNSDFEEVIEKLEKSRREMENETEILRKERLEAESKAREAVKIRDETEARANKEIERARQEASTLVSRTRARADMLLNELEEIKRQGNKALTAERKAKLRAGMNELDDMANPVRERRNERYKLPRPLKIGDDVLIFDIDKKAVVLELPKDGMVYVQAGIIKTRVKLNNLRLLGEKQEQNRQERRKHKTVTKTNFSAESATEVDLRGKNSEEALMDMEAAIDQALIRGIQRLTVIHGKGTGVLRTAVQQRLRQIPAVKSFRLGIFGEGESGVTIIEF